MRRRTFIVGTTSALSLLTGCISRFSSQSGTETLVTPVGRSSNRSTQATSTNTIDTTSTETAQPTATRTETTTDTTNDETAATSHPISNTNQSPSECRKTPSTPGTAVVEASRVVLSIENTTDAQQTVEITVTPLPESTTPRPSEEAPHEPRNLSESPVFSESTELQGDGVKVYRCIGLDGPSHGYQILVQAGENLSAAYDWAQNTYELTVDITGSSIEFSARSGE